MIPAPEDRVVIAKITSVHGVKGWVKVHSFTEPMENFLQHRHCFVNKGDTWQRVEIDQSRRQGKGIVAHIVGLDDRELAREWAGCELAVARTQLPVLTEGEYYWHQLEGLQVWLSSDLGSESASGDVQADPMLLGKVSHMMATGANDVLVVRKCAGSIDRQERLIPWVPDRFIDRVDIADGKIWVHWDPAF